MDSQQFKNVGAAFWSLTPGSWFQQHPKFSLRNGNFLLGCGEMYFIWINFKSYTKE
jgi:hypothetical protein